MALFSRVTVWVSNQVLTAAALNGEFNNILNNAMASSWIGFSANVSQMQQQTSPGGVGTESLAGSISDELQRLRFMFAYTLGTTYWYDQTGRNLGVGNLAVTTADLDPSFTVGTSNIDNGAVTLPKIDTGVIGLSLNPGSQIITTAGTTTFTVPTNVTRLLVYGAGGGGGGCGGEPGASSTQAGAGGNGVQPTSYILDGLTPGDSITAVVGTGGSGGSPNSGGSNGSSTTFGSLTFYGGLGGMALGNSPQPGLYNGTTQITGGVGGANGSNPGTIGSSSLQNTGGTAGGVGTSGNAGGGGGGAGIGAGGRGGDGGVVSVDGGGGGQSAGGGGGGGGHSTGGAGGAGGSGYLAIYW